MNNKNTPHECSVLFSSRAEVLPFFMISKLRASGLLLLVFWGRGLLSWFSGVLALVEICLPCQGARLNVSGFRLHYMVLFYSLKAFSTDGRDENVSTPSLALELKVGTPHSSVSPQRKQSITLVSLVSVCSLCSPSLWPSVFDLRHTTLIWVSKLYRFPVELTCIIHPRGRRGASPHFCLLLGGGPESSPVTLQRFAVYGNTEQKVGVHICCF